MGRPDFGTVMVSKFVSKKEFKVLDMRIPSKQSWDEDTEKCITFFPLVIATMIQVGNRKDTYKPEYLIPQLLTEWIITHNWQEKPDNEIAGILFTSTKKNKDFDFPEVSFDNYAIPVLKPLTKGKYCARLSEMFHLTAPTYYDLEVLKQGQIIAVGEFGLDVELQKEENYNTSRFGVMERYLEHIVPAKVTDN